jgi:hypothetical protein
VPDGCRFRIKNGTETQRDERLRRHSHVAALSFNLVTDFTVATHSR